MKKCKHKTKPHVGCIFDPRATAVAHQKEDLLYRSPPPPAGGTKQLPPTPATASVYIVKDAVEMAPPVSSAMLLADATHLRFGRPSMLSGAQGKFCNK